MNRRRFAALAAAAVLISFGPFLPLPPLSFYTPPPTPTVTMADRILELENVVRIANGLQPLTVSKPLTASAQTYAIVLANGGVFGHEQPFGLVFYLRDEAAGYVGWTYLAEIIARGYPSAGDTVDAWLLSPEHRAVILSPEAREMGVGVDGPMVVEELGSRVLP